MSGGGPVRTHYELLGVQPDATEDAVRRAYDVALAGHLATHHREYRRRLDAAFETLSTPDAREAYDRRMLLPEGVRAELDRALARVVDAPDRASALLESARREHGEYPLVRLRAAIGLVQLGRHEDAMEELTALAAELPECAEALYWVGVVHARRDNAKQAARWLRDATAVAPLWRDAYIQLAYVLEAAGDAREALSVLDQGIHADDRVDPSDVPLLRRKLPLLAVLRDWEGLRRTTNALDANLSPDDRAGRDEVVETLRELAGRFDAGAHPRLCERLVESARQIDPEARIEVVRPVPDAKEIASRNAPRVLADRSVPEWTRDLVRHAFHLDPELEIGERERALEDLVAVVRARLDRVDREWAHFSVAYPDVAGVAASEWQELRRRARSGVAQIAPTRQPVAASRPPVAPVAPVATPPAPASSTRTRRRSPAPRSRRRREPEGSSVVAKIAGMIVFVVMLIVFILLKAVIREMFR